MKLRYGRQSPPTRQVPPGSFHTNTRIGAPAREPLERLDKHVNELAPRRAQFVAEYLIDLNATRAAERAGYSPKTAYSQGQRLLKNVEVQGAIQAAMDKRATKLEITADRVLQEIAKLAFFDPAAFFEDDGSLKRIQDLDAHTRMAIAGIEVVELFEGSGEQKHAYGLLKKVKLADKGRNLERLGRHLKLFTDKSEHSGLMGVQLIHSIPQPEREEDTDLQPVL
jgi:phage terminase small subunit